MAINAFLSFFDKADGESVQKGKEKWVEIMHWAWDVQADTSWTKGGGASVGKPNPGRFSFGHRFNRSSIPILGYICSGKAFPKVELQLTQAGAKGAPETYFTLTLEGVFITAASHSGDEQGGVTQSVEMVFKAIRIDYKMQDKSSGGFVVTKPFTWDVPAGKAEPSA